jgi:hypothetical protein
MSEGAGTGAARGTCRLRGVAMMRREELELAFNVDVPNAI